MNHNNFSVFFSYSSLESLVSGTVVVASIDYGLFTVRPNYAAIEEQKNKLHSEKTHKRSVVSCENNVKPSLEGHASCAQPVC